jgi:hypothetical protein
MGFVKSLIVARREHASGFCLASHRYQICDGQQCGYDALKIVPNQVSISRQFIMRPNAIASLYDLTWVIPLVFDPHVAARWGFR